MVITYKHPGGDTILCHGTGRRGEPGFYTGPVGASDTSRAEWQTQTVLPIRAPTAKHLDRANGSYAYAFAVERRFSTEAEAIIYKELLPASIPRTGGSIVLSEIGTDRIVMDSAVLQRLNASRTGTSLDITFEFATSLPKKETP